MGKKNKGKDIQLAKELVDLWDENEEHMGEQAAYQVSCEQLGIDPDRGYELMEMLQSWNK